jgi:AcrR family transcriptional regulator
VTSHRQRLIDEAGSLFKSGGFHAVSLDSILRAAETTKTTFYKHFESKDELALICLRNTRNEWWAWVDGRIEEAGCTDPVDRMRLFFQLIGERIQSEPGSVFPCFAACGEFPHRTDARNAEGRDSLREVEQRLRAWAAEAGARDPDTLAAQLAVAAKGAILHELAHREGRSAAIAADVAEVLLDRHFEPAGA